MISDAWYLDPAQFPESVEAKCSECGHIWMYERHEALNCPFCNAVFKSVEFNPGKTYAFFHGHRWKAILKENRSVEKKSLPDSITKGLHNNWEGK